MTETKFRDRRINLQEIFETDEGSFKDLLREVRKKVLD